MFFPDGLEIKVRAAEMLPQEHQAPRVRHAGRSVVVGRRRRQDKVRRRARVRVHLDVFGAFAAVFFLKAGWWWRDAGVREQREDGGGGAVRGAFGEGDDAGDAMLLQALGVEQQRRHDDLVVDDEAEPVLCVDLVMRPQRLDALSDLVHHVRDGGVVAGELLHLVGRQRDGHDGEALLGPFLQRLRVQWLLHGGGPWRDGGAAGEDGDEAWAGAAAGERRLEHGGGADGDGRGRGQRRSNFVGGGRVVGGGERGHDGGGGLWIERTGSFVY